MTAGSHPLRRLVRLVAGWAFVLLGIVGLFLPILQGVLFLFVGITLLSLASPRVRLWRIRLGRRFPAFRATQQRARAWMVRQRARFGRRAPPSSPS